MSQENIRTEFEQDIIQDPDIGEDGNRTKLAKKILPNSLSILPLYQRPFFPGIVVPLTFSGSHKIEQIKNAYEEHGGFMGLVLAESAEQDESNGSPPELYDVGTVFQIFRIANVGPNAVQVLGQGLRRFEKRKVLLVEPFLRWEVNYIEDAEPKKDTELKAYMLAISGEVKNLLALNPLFKEQVNQIVSQLNYDTPGLTMDLISNLLTSDKAKLQRLLETFNLHQRAKLLLEFIKEELEVAKIQARITEQINEKVSKQQREYFLREQLSAIKKELGIEKEDKEADIEKLEKKLADKELTEEAASVVKDELNKLKTINPQSPEYNVTRNYLELIADLPWGIYSEDNTDIKKAREILDREHYGLQDVKDRILEFIAAVIRRGKVAGSIICLVGPPGVGKTSIGKSVASALDRKFFRFSVGGMRDEAEIKGHRRTYIGAMPGKLINSLKRVETANPVIMLDEIDKIGTSFRGDPASALLEVLDPEQNSTFIDHYLDIPFDLSNVLFITTANQLETIPGPLRDRMEVIRLSGYILQEKVEIARQFLIPKQLEAHGFSGDEITFEKKALAVIADKYAREAGVRNLEKQIRKIIRKASLKMTEEGGKKLKIGARDVESYLGKPVFHTEQLYDEPIAGVALGLAYTQLGGTTIYIEASAIRSKGPGFKQTGQLGEVMKESAEIAYSYVRAVLSEDIELAKFFDTHFVHLHVPAGATPKDGPSAGITMALALYSLATDKPVRIDVAMTGELTLTGRVLPIGGLKEKTIAARRVGVHELIFPKENESDFSELQDYVKEGLQVHFVETFEDVLKIVYKDS